MKERRGDLEMDIASFADRVEAAHRRLDALYRNPQVQSNGKDALLEETLEQLQSALEELRVAEEELSFQNHRLVLANQKLEAERERYRELFHFAPDAYLVTDMYGVIRDANNAAAALFQIEARFLISKPLASYIALESRPEFRKRLNHIRDFWEPQRWEMRLCPRTQSCVDVGMTVIVSRDWAGKPVGLRWILRDISSHTQALQVSEARFRQIGESGIFSLFGIISFDLFGRIRDASDAFLQMIGYSREEMLAGRVRWDRLTPPEWKRRIQEAVAEMKAHGRCRPFEAEYLRKDQMRFWGLFGGAIIKGSSEGVAFVLDITERKQLEEGRIADQAHILNQERQAAILQERNRMAREIHDVLAQAFVGITIQVEGIEDILPEASGEVRRHLEKMRALAGQGLAEARRSVRALRPQMLEDTTLADALRRMVEDVAPGSGISIKFELMGVPYLLSAETEVELLRIGQEALTNALRHARAQHIRMTLSFDTDEVQLCVHDDGLGFSRPKAKSGFGLIGMRERAERLGGQLKIVSKPGKGTGVHMTVPLIRPHAVENIA
jgi:PAS domain S-box-containing protein